MCVNSACVTACCVDGRFGRDLELGEDECQRVCEWDDMG